MNKIVFDKKLEKKKLNKPVLNVKNKDSSKRLEKEKIVKRFLHSSKEEYVSSWNFLYTFLFFCLIFGLLIFNLVKLQVVEGGLMLERSKTNKVRITPIEAFRGVIFDSTGKKLVENIASVDVYVLLDSFKEKEGINDAKLEKVLNTIGGILGDSWKKGDNSEYSSLIEMVYSVLEKDEYANKVLLASDVNNDQVIKIKAKKEELVGIVIDDGSKRSYTSGEAFSHVLGYTSQASEKDLQEFSWLSIGSIVGKTGVERLYEQQLHGTDGKLAEEVDVYGRSLSQQPYKVSEPVSGKNLYLTINGDVQNKVYEILGKSVKKYDAAGGAVVIEDVNNGEILSIVSYPSYDNNLFVNGITQEEYSRLITHPQNPLLDRPISAQLPPGSTFKTIVAAAGLESGVITKNTRYLSRTGYTFSNGAPFKEFQNHAYGSLNVVDALMVSSNIFFCEMIRDWNMNELVPYLERFGIGQYTGVDLPGEMSGRLPSPENKRKLAQTISPWLEEVWYPEGDSCNSVIGQGITLVTPIQMSNWIAAIANGGTLYTPHVGKKFVDENGLEFPIEYDVIRENVVSDKSLKIVREGMWSVVNGSRGIAKALSTTGVTVAAKTGTAEFGKVNEKGEYEDTHAWVTGFFPYENPKYSFSLLLEDGGTSANAVATIKEIITWMVQNGLAD